MVSPRRRVVVAGHDLKFFHRLRAALEESGLFEFREDLWTGHNRHDEDRSRALLDWADIVFCEWCLGNAVWYSNHRRPHQHLVVRFHLAERNTPYPRRLNIDSVATIAFVGAHIQREAQELLDLPPNKTCVVPNLIDVKHFNREKFEGAFFNLGIMGIVPLRKRLDLALDTLELLKKRDDRYTLHIKGAHPASYQWVWRDTREQEYYLAQWERINAAEWGNSVVFDPQGDDVADWFRCIGFILSPSDFESFHMSVSEGMSSGTLPIIWDWEGAEEIHPQRFIVSSPQEAADMIEELRRSGNLKQLREEVREYVRRKFDLRVVNDRWIELLSVSE